MDRRPAIDAPTSAPEAAFTPRARLARWAALSGLLYGFLVAIELMSKAIQLLSTATMGAASAGDFFAGVHNPFAGLAVGVLATVLVQSSSTTTSTIVAVVGSGALPVAHAVPMIMGANIGTTITNTLVSLGSLRRRAEFRRAFAAGTVHDFFNLLTVVVLLPLELATRFLTRGATFLAARFRGTGEGGIAHADGPIKAGIKASYKAVLELLEALGLDGRALAVTALLVGVALTFVSLYFITRTMRQLLAGRIERAMNRALETAGIVPILIGTALTVAVQSSSITTSMLVPLCASGVLSLAHAYPIVLGANIGTTATALIASAAQDGRDALTIAFVHLLFNLTGVLLFYPVPALRQVPIRLATGLAALADRSRIWVVVYILGVFLALPLLGWFLWHTK